MTQVDAPDAVILAGLVAHFRIVESNVGTIRQFGQGLHEGALACLTRADDDENRELAQGL